MAVILFDMYTCTSLNTPPLQKQALCVPGLIISHGELFVTCPTKTFNRPVIKLSHFPSYLVEILESQRMCH